MISIESYTCAECGGPVTVEDVPGGEPCISRSCGHDRAIVHANLRGRVFGESAIQNGTVPDAEIPAEHRAAFEARMGDRRVLDGGAVRWRIRDWMEFIAEHHAERARQRRG